MLNFEKILVITTYLERKDASDLSTGSRQKEDCGSKENWCCANEAGYYGGDCLTMASSVRDNSRGRIYETTNLEFVQVVVQWPEAG
jgi:hypothetical protein